MEYQNLSGRDLDNWAEARGIKRYQGFLFPDSDEKFKEEIAKKIVVESNPNDNQFIQLIGSYGHLRGRLVLVDKIGDFLFEMDPTCNGCSHDFDSRDLEFKEKFPELKNSRFFWMYREDSKCLGVYESEYLKIEKTNIRI
jgi:hypothetical protein